MSDTDKLLEKNRIWSQRQLESDPDFFNRLAALQAPKFLWIGCSDSRVPANQIMGLAPGEVFVHRNVANLVVHSDLNCLSVMQYAVEVLQVKHIILCGHYGCGGIDAVLRGRTLGLIDNWLRGVQDNWQKQQKNFSALGDEHKFDALCEINVIEQARNVCVSTVVQDAWKRGQDLTVQGWIYGLNDGLLREMGMCINKDCDLEASYTGALRSVLTRRGV